MDSSNSIESLYRHAQVVLPSFCELIRCLYCSLLVLVAGGDRAAYEAGVNAISLSFCRVCQACIA